MVWHADGATGRWIDQSFDGDFHQEAVGEVLAGQINHSNSPLGMDKLQDDDPPDTDNTLSGQLLEILFDL